MQGIGQLKVTMHQKVPGRVKTIQIKRQGWCCRAMMCRPPGYRSPAANSASACQLRHHQQWRAHRQSGWGPRRGGPLSAAQRRLLRAKRKSKTRVGKRETVAARHRKVTNQRKDFHHNRPAVSLKTTICGWCRDWRSPAWSGRLNPCPIPTIPASFWATARGRSPGCLEAAVTLRGPVRLNTAR